MSYELEIASPSDIERVDLEVDIAHNFSELMQQSQERHPVDHKRKALRGQLIDPLAQTYEVRMNRSLQAYKDLLAHMGRMADGRGTE